MLRTLVDELMGTNAAIVLVVAHIAALAWAALLRKGMTPALLLNLILSAFILAYNADHLLIMLQVADTTLLALMAYAAAVLACSAGALYGLRMPTWINWTAFAINFGLSILLLAFLATFRITRLF